MAQISAAELVERLKITGKTLATAESCTGGMIGAEITSVPGSSSVFMGGIISYDNSVKTGVLRVKEETLMAYGAVSTETAAEMADGAKKCCGADIAVSVTGIAGPGGGSAEKPVGTVCFGVSFEGKCRTVRCSFPEDAARDEIRRMATLWAISMVYDTLSNI